MFNFRSIRSKFIFAFTIYLFVVFFGILAIIYIFIGGMLTQGVIGEVVAYTGQGANRMDGWFAGKRATVDSMYHTFVALPNEDAIHQALQNLTDGTTLHYVGFADERAIFGADITLPDDWTPLIRPWYIDAMANRGEITFSSPFIDAYSGEIIISISRYFGQILGSDMVYSIDIQLSDIVSILHDTLYISGSYAFLAEQNGRILAHTGDVQSGTNMHDITAYQQFLNAGVGQDEPLRIRDDARRSWYLTYHELENGWMLFMAVPRSFVQFDTIILMIVAVLALIPIMVLQILMFWFAFGYIVSKPLNKLKNDAKQISLGNL
ncbi:MAG: cache domain-containing protein [Defluviitaleaceae bacterium]|nr:cache domain-containing protein [Defluviitaleaceae bacterium]